MSNLKSLWSCSGGLIGDGQPGSRRHNSHRRTAASKWRNAPAGRRSANRPRLAKVPHEDGCRTGWIRDRSVGGANRILSVRQGDPAYLQCQRISCLRSRAHLGGCRPEELAQSRKCNAVSTRRALFRSASCSAPGRRRAAFSRISLANEPSRSFREMVCFRRRRIRVFALFEDISRGFSRPPPANMPPANMR